MNEKEPTRIRECGTKVVNPQNGEERIAAIRDIVDAKSYAKIDGMMVDLFTASTILAVYRNLNDENKAKYREQTVSRMVEIAYYMCK